jgi:hypothetical protein
MTSARNLALLRKAMNIGALLTVYALVMLILANYLDYQAIESAKTSMQTTDILEIRCSDVCSDGYHSEANASTCCSD